MSDERNRLKSDEGEKENDDVEAHRFHANDEGASNDDDGDDDVEAHVLKK